MNLDKWRFIESSWLLASIKIVNNWFHISLGCLNLKWKLNEFSFSYSKILGPVVVNAWNITKRYRYMPSEEKKLILQTNNSFTSQREKNEQKINELNRNKFKSSVITLWIECTEGNWHCQWCEKFSPTGAMYLYFFTFLK